MSRVLNREKYDITKLLQAIKNRNERRVIQLILAGTPTFTDVGSVLHNITEDEEQFLLDVLTPLEEYQLFIKHRVRAKSGKNKVILSEFLSQLLHFSHVQYGAMQQANSNKSNQHVSHIRMVNPSVRQLQSVVDKGVGIE